MTFNPQAFKQQFPLFSQIENQDLVYLDNAATTQKPQCVIDAIGYFYLHNNGNAQRSSHRLARKSTELINTVRKKTQEFLGAKSEEEIVFTQGATASINMIAHGLRAQLTPTDCIAVSYGEHHANLLPWQEASNATGCKLTLVSPSVTELINGSIADKESLKIIAITLASNALGNITQVETLLSLRQQYPQSIIVLDITQWIAHRPINLQSLPCDFAVCSAHKFFGPTGLGILYGREALIGKLKPMLVGGEMVATVMPTSSTYVTGYQALEAGTSPMAAIAALGACLEFWSRQDRNAIIKHEETLNLYLHQKLQELVSDYSAITLLTQPKDNIGIATLACSPQYSISDLAIWLDERNIAVRSGEHCTQLLWKNHQPTINGGTLRLSLAAYNTKDHIDIAINAIKDYCDFLEKNNVKKENIALDKMDYEKLLSKTSWQQRYKQLILWGKSLPQQDDIRMDNYLIKGCESAVWLKHEKNRNTHYFIVDSDSNVVKGLAALTLCRINGKTSEAIQQINFEEYFRELGLEQHLSQSRMNGFMILYKAMMKEVLP